MGITERKEREKAERKALIIRCAKDLILEQGAEAVSMGDIAKRAELSKATLYIYFSSKDIIFQEICVEAGFQFIEYFRSLHKSGMSALESIKLFWNCYVDIYGKSDDLIILFNMKRYLMPDYPFISLQEDDPVSVGPSFELFNMIRKMIKEGIDEGSFEPDVNPTIITHTILSLFSLSVENAAKFSEKALNSDFSFVDEMKNIFQILLRGIAREGIPRSLLVLEDSGKCKRKPMKPLKRLIREKEEAHAKIF
jgi:AcrR family transcriptional regulator